MAGPTGAVRAEEASCQDDPKAGGRQRSTDTAWSLQEQSKLVLLLNACSEPATSGHFIVT